MATRREYLIVDGHSIIFAWPELRAVHARRTAVARDALVKRLTDYQDHSGVRVVVVFDGQGGGSRASEATEPGGIQVFYAPSGRTADDFVERLVAKYGEVHEISVATDDRLVEQTAISFGAQHCLSAERLRDLLDTAERDFSRRLRQVQRRS